MARERLRMRRRVIIVIVIILLVALTIGGFFAYKRWGGFCGAVSPSDMPQAVDTNDGSPDGELGASDSDEVELSAAQNHDDETDGGIFGSLFSGCGGYFGGDKAVSESDGQEFEPWELQPDDAAYIAMMTEKFDEFTIYITELSALEKTLARCVTPEQVKANERYARLSDQLTRWCRAAIAYPNDGLIGDDAQAICNITAHMSECTLRYLEIFPEVMVGEYSGELSADELVNGIADDAVILFEQLG